MGKIAVNAGAEVVVGQAQKPAVVEGFWSLPDGNLGARIDGLLPSPATEKVLNRRMSS